MADMLSVQNVSKRFGGLQAVSKVSLGVNEGSIVSIIGPNGAGKTVLLNLISGIYKVNEGSIFFDGQRIDLLPAYKIANIGMARTFQLIRLFKRSSVLQNVMVGRYRATKTGVLGAICQSRSARSEEQATQDYAWQTLRLVNLESQANQIASALPHGQQRLVELARALACEPKLLLLDEPAGGLNQREVQDLQGILKVIQERGITIILVEHRMDFVMNLADEIFVLNYGELIAQGTPEVIRGNPLVIKAYLGKE